MAHGHNTHASAVAAGYRQFSHGGDTRPLHYVHVWMLAQRAQGDRRLSDGGLHLGGQTRRTMGSGSAAC
eukprot:1933386-Pleurochrysis_carterae.AAC.1